jgi:hypothetical protein
MKLKHELHTLGFFTDGRLPIMRMTGAAAPAKGAAHSWQRGPWGRSLKTLRTFRSIASPRVRKVRQNSSFSGPGGLDLIGAPFGRPR